MHSDLCCVPKELLKEDRWNECQQKILRSEEIKEEKKQVRLIEDY